MDEVAELFYACLALEFAQAFDPVPVLRMRGGRPSYTPSGLLPTLKICSAHLVMDPACPRCRPVVQGLMDHSAELVMAAVAHLEAREARARQLRQAVLEHLSAGYRPTGV